MLERLKSFRKKKKSYFPFSKLPDSLKVRILQYLEPVDISSFASCSKDSELFVKEHQKELPLYEFEFMDICYDPVTDAACLRAVNDTKYSVSLKPDLSNILSSNFSNLLLSMLKPLIDISTA